MSDEQIMRYELETTSLKFDTVDYVSGMAPSTDGEYILYTDHAAALARQSEELAEAKRELTKLVELGAVMRAKQNRFAESYPNGDASKVRQACDDFDTVLAKHADRLNRERKQALTPPTTEKR